MILTPYGHVQGQYPSEVVASIGGRAGQNLCPQDPLYHSQGEDGMYHDTPLGHGGVAGPQVIAQGPVPSDFQTATAYQYTPSVRGWIATSGGYVQGPLYPQPAPPAAMMYPVSPMPLGDAAVPTTDADADAAKRANITFWMQVITGSVIGTSALIAIYRGLKGIGHDRMVRHALELKLNQR